MVMIRGSNIVQVDSKFKQCRLLPDLKLPLTSLLINQYYPPSPLYTLISLSTRTTNSFANVMSKLCWCVCEHSADSQLPKNQLPLKTTSVIRKFTSNAIRQTRQSALALFLPVPNRVKSVAGGKVLTFLY